VFLCRTRLLIESKCVKVTDYRLMVEFQKFKHVINGWIGIGHVLKWNKYLELATSDMHEIVPKVTIVSIYRIWNICRSERLLGRYEFTVSTEI